MALTTRNTIAYQTSLIFPIGGRWQHFQEADTVPCPLVPYSPKAQWHSSRNPGKKRTNSWSPKMAGNTGGPATHIRDPITLESGKGFWQAGLWINSWHEIFPQCLLRTTSKWSHQNYCKMYTLNADSRGKECTCYAEFIISISECSHRKHLFGIAFIQLFGT